MSRSSGRAPGLYALLVGLALAGEAPPAQSAAEPLAGFPAFAEAARLAWQVPGVAMAIVRDGEVVLRQGFGERDRERHLPVTPETLFAIGSATKAFTTFVVGTLVDEGKLDWDRPVRGYLPWFRLEDPAATELLTPRDLVTHRSGLPRHDLLWYNNQSLGRRELVERLAHLESSQSLRSRFQYNNLMYLTAGYLVEEITGATWEEEVRRRIFTPLGMAASNFSVAESQRAADHALPYKEKDGAVARIPFRDITTVGPAGSINSHLDDMARWVELHLAGGRAGDRRLIGAATLADIHSPHMVTGESVERPEISQGAYGLAWFIDAYRGHRRVSHGGNIDGFSALVTLFPQDGLGMVVLANLDASPLPGLLTQHAADRILGLEPIDWNGEALGRRALGKAAEREAKGKKESVRRDGTRPAHPLAEYAGRYAHPGYGPLDVTLRDGKLELAYNSIRAPLEHWHYEIFHAPEGAADPVFENVKFLFSTDVRGNVASVSAPFEPQVKDIVFVRQPDARLSDPAYLERLVGEYELAGQTITIALAGSTLTVNIPGQPQHRLVPGLGGEFTLAEDSVVKLRFEQDPEGRATAALFDQPEGIYRAPRKP